MRMKNILNVLGDNVNYIELYNNFIVYVRDFKLYLSDVGLLTSLLEIQYNDILLDNSFLYKGNIAENYVATQLVRNGLSLYYWKYML